MRIVRIIMPVRTWAEHLSKWQIIVQQSVLRQAYSSLSSFCIFSLIPVYITNQKWWCLVAFLMYAFVGTCHEDSHFVSLVAALDFFFYHTVGNKPLCIKQNKFFLLNNSLFFTSTTLLSKPDGLKSKTFIKQRVLFGYLCTWRTI